MIITNESVENIRFTNDNVDVLKFNGVVVWERRTQHKLEWGPGSSEIESFPDLFNYSEGLVFQKGTWFSGDNGFIVKFRVTQGFINYQYKFFSGNQIVNKSSKIMANEGDVVELIFDKTQNIVNFEGLGISGKIVFIDDSFENSVAQCWPYGFIYNFGKDCFTGRNFITDTRYLKGSFDELPDFSGCRYLKYINLTNFDLSENLDFRWQFYNSGQRLDDLNIEHYIFVKDNANLKILNNHLSELIDETSKYITGIASIKP